MSGWSPMLDMLIVAIALTSGAFGWMVRADRSDRQVQDAYDRGYEDAVRHYRR